MPDEYDVFLSHSSADVAMVEEIAGRLQEEAELVPFLEKWDLIPGESWVPALERALTISKTVAVFFGQQPMEAWNAEAKQLGLILSAQKREKRVIPVLLPGARERDIDGFLGLRTWVDLAEEDGFARLIAGIIGQAPRPTSDPKQDRRGATARKTRSRRTLVSPRPPTRVFVSSTLCDHEEHRRDLIETIDMVGMEPLPASMEPLPVSTEPSVIEARRKQLEGCELLLLLVAWRYGRIPDGHDRSIAEIEYEWACEHEIPRLVFLIDESRPVVVSQEFDEGDERWSKQLRLQAFKSRLQREGATEGFTNENITGRVARRLHDWRLERDAAASNARAPRSPVVHERAAVEALAAADAAVPTTGAAGTPSADATGERKRRRRSSKPRTRPSRPRDLSRYLEAIERDNATTTMFGSAVPLEIPLRPDDLRVEIRLAPARASHERAEPEAHAPEPALGLHEVFALAEHHGCRCVVLVGQPGSGKSTHLRRMALWLSRRNAKTLGLPVDTIPILLPLSELAAEGETFHAAIVAHLQRDPSFDAAFVEALLEREHLLFLVDGLDEVPDERHHERVVDWLDRGLREHPNARFLVTHRPSEQGAERWPAPVLEVQLPPLAEPDARALVERWFRGMEPSSDTAQADAQRKCDALWAELKTPAFRSTRMFELTRNPLMLTVLCMLHRQRGSLPTRRVELYEQCVQVLLQRWRDMPGLPRRFGDREARQVLQPLAHWLHDERGRTHADARSLASAIEPHLAAALGYEVEGEAFLRAVSTEDGLLIAKGDSLGLLHLGFQEYLCARHLRSLSHGDPGVLDRLADRFGDPWWREVTLLLLALGEPALFQPLMRKVVERPAFVEHQDWVVDCIHEAAEVSFAPFLELLARPPGEDAELWRRQLAVWRVLERLDPARLDGVAGSLRDHPYDALREAAGHGSQPTIIFSARGGYPLVEIPAGRFTMGSHHRERGHRGEEGPWHEVELAGFWIGKHPVTNEEYGLYLRVCPEVVEPCYWGDPRYNQPQQPVVGVSWHEAAAYCTWAGLRLPTEAQWEYACRAGTTGAYWSGREEEDLERVGWYTENSGQRPHAVEEKPANAFGLHDVHGNVWEWCSDDFGIYRDHPPRPGDGLRHLPQDGNRVIRGGSWIDRARMARSAYRLNRHADNRPSNLGFRAVKVLEPDEAEEP
jgi:formylglycine-generating enzyme required for sulfatase activity